MNCRDMEDRIALYAGGDLPESEVTPLEDHLAGCVDCAELAASMVEDRQRLRMRPPELADVDFDAMRRDLRRQVVRGQQVRRWVPVMAVAAALVVAALIPGRTGRRVVPPVAPVVKPTPAPALASNDVPKPRPAVPVRKTDGIRRPSVLRSDVQMRLTTADPNVMIILLPFTTENPNE